MTSAARFRPATVIATALVALVALVTTAAGVLGGGEDTKLMVVAHFKDASPLLVGNDVRMHGVKVGRVSSVAASGTGADVGLELEAAALPVHQDATATVRPVSLLGERYVDLDAGSTQVPTLENGGQIGLERTGSAVDLDDVLGSLDAPTSDSLAGMVGALGGGLDGNGANAEQAISALGPSMASTAEMATILSEQNATLQSLVTSMDRVTAGLAADQGQAMDSMLRASEALTGVTAENEAAFRQVLQQLPGSLAATRKTLVQLEGTADAATPTLEALRPTTSQLNGLSTDLLAFTEAANPALRDLNPVLDRADELLAEAGPVAQLLRKQSGVTAQDAAALDSLTATMAPRFRTVMEFVKGWALATNGRDGLGHYFRGGLVLSPHAATGHLPGGTPSTGGLLDTAPVPDPSSLLGSVGSQAGGLLSPQTSEGGVTGLDQEQEQSILSNLLGGS